MSGELNAAFHMADVRNKRISRRRAVAVGELHAGPVAYPLIVERRLPKGDALVMAEIAGLQGAKMASMLMPLCHPLPLELVQVFCAPVPERHAIRVWCECASEARTGVEMEALVSVNAALLTLYDLSKPVEPLCASRASACCSRKAASAASGCTRMAWTMRSARVSSRVRRRAWRAPPAR